MRVECAVICDAASIRENLLNVLGGGVSRISFNEFPGHPRLTFAFRVVLESRELRDQHVLRLRLVDYTGAAVNAVDLTFTVQDPKQATEEAALGAPVPLDPFEIPHAGKYLLEVSFDNRAVATLPLMAEQAPQIPVA